MKIDYKKINDLYMKSKTLREIAISNDLPIEQSMKIRKEQDEAYKKHKFLKGLTKARDKEKRGNK